MKLTEKEKEQILKSGAEAMSRIIERMSIERGELEEENKKLKEKLSKWEQGEYRYFGNDGEQDIYEITSIKDGPITYTKDSTGKLVADGETPYVLC